MNKETTEIPFGIDSGATEYVCYIPDGMEAIVEDGKVIIRKKKSDDEKLLDQIIDIINTSQDVKFRDKVILSCFLEKIKEQWIK